MSRTRALALSVDEYRDSEAKPGARVNRDSEAKPRARVNRDSEAKPRARVNRDSYENEDGRRARQKLLTQKLCPGSDRSADGGKDKVDNMEISSFARKIRDAIKKELGDEYSVELKEVRKNNGVLLHGLLILSRKKNVVPTIYLETFYAAYEDGVPFGEILRRILEIYREEVPQGSVDMDFFKSFCKVRDRICYRLVRVQGNEALLEKIPHVEFLDLAICFYYAYYSGALGEGSILIHDTHMEMWGVGTQELMQLAEKNTPRLFPGRLCSMLDILNEVSEVGGTAEPDDEIPLMVLSNERRINGAACILYPGMLQRIAEQRKCSFYILPSSIHEVLILEQTGAEKPAELRRMIYEVNREHLAEEEVLSDNLYFFDRVKKNVKIIF